MHNNDDDKPLDGDGFDGFRLTVQLDLATEKASSTATQNLDDKDSPTSLSNTAYWLENLNTPVNERIKTRFTPGTTFFALQQVADEQENLLQSERIEITQGKERQDTH
ncbi:hypothetical protein [Cellvibrio sp. PSBB006]|uniref:hypothetical protein n=1 Tax=Cellvibrio sp. PSBB006 TaxID=1987723 RepID=UPI000B3B693B|nr:hypothetical protein [Cellvibrio sp. PSBB006]ARU26655.1 hypothetical protein CBR65_03990 [Cellvibrio sp. PSBB006]